MASCPLCWNNATRERMPNVMAAWVSCPACGTFGVTRALELFLSGSESNPDERALLRVAARQAHERDQPLMLSECESDPGFFHKVASAVRVPSLSDAVVPLLSLVKARSGTKLETIFIGDHDYLVLGFVDRAPVTSLLRDLTERKYLRTERKRGPSGVHTAHYVLTLAGDEYLTRAARQARGLTGWDKVDRQLAQAESEVPQARTEEQFQSVGHVCREVLISLGQEVYRSDQHLSHDGKTISKTDSAGMLQAYLSATIRGASSEEARRLVKAAESFTNAVTHKRSATFRDAALCLEATRFVVELIAIIEGKRDQ